jgi:hypothetical protein
MDVHIHPLIRLHGVVLNYLSTGAILPFIRIRKSTRQEKISDATGYNKQKPPVTQNSSN